jgi:hypothetical protein
LATVIFKVYIVHGLLGIIDIVSVEDITQAGGAVYFNVLQNMSVTQNIAGQEHQYNLVDNSSVLISPTGGAIPLRQERKLWYLNNFDVSTDPAMQSTINAIMADVDDVYKIAPLAERQASYSKALGLACGRQQQLHAVRALQTSTPSLPVFPPNLSLYDAHRSADGPVDPLKRLDYNFHDLQVQAATAPDRHAEERSELLLTLQRAVHQRRELAPPPIGIRAIHSAPMPSTEPHLDFTGTDVTTSSGPHPAPADGPPCLATPAPDRSGRR